MEESQKSVEGTWDKGTRDKGQGTRKEKQDSSIKNKEPRSKNQASTKRKIKRSIRNKKEEGTFGIECR